MNYSLSRKVVGAIILLLLPVCAASGADVFDKPLDKTVVKLPADPITRRPSRSVPVFTIPASW